MILGELTEGYYMVFNVSKKVDFVSIGDTVALKTQGNMELEGKIQDMKSVEDNLQIEMAFKSGEIKENESIKAVLKKQSATYDLLIPYGALNKDQNKYYVARVVNDTLGESYIIKKCDVYVEDYNESYVANRGSRVSWVYRFSSLLCDEM